MASIMASTLAGSRPSEKLGTHSTRVLGMGRRITGGGWVRQLGFGVASKFTHHQGHKGPQRYEVRLGSFVGFASCYFVRFVVELAPHLHLTRRNSNMQTAKLDHRLYLDYAVAASTLRP